MKNIIKKQNTEVKQSNYIIEAHFKKYYSLQELKLIIFAISTISTHSPLDKPINISITAKKFAELMNTHVDNVYRDGHKIADSLMSKTLSFKQPGGWLVVNWFSSIKYKNGIINAKIDPDLIPYLLEFKERGYTMLNLEIIAKMSSSYAIKLYQFLARYKDIGNITISLDDLQSMLGISEQKSLRIYNRFKQKILEISKREINSKTNLQVTYTEIKPNRKVVALQFEIKECLKVNQTTEQPLLLEMLPPHQEYKNVELQDVASLRDNLLKIGFIQRELDNLIKKYPISKIHDKYQYFVFSQKIIRTPKAWIISALKNDYNTSDMHTELKKLEEDTQRRIAIENETLRQRQGEEYFEQEFTKWENSKTDEELAEIGKKIYQDTPLFKSALKAQRGSTFFKNYFRSCIKKQSPQEKS